MCIRRTCFTGFIIASVGLASLAHAGSITHTQNWSFPLSPNSAVLSFPQFDDLEGVRELTQVTIGLDALVQAWVTGENNSTIPGQLTLNLNGNVSSTAPGGLSVALTLNQTAGPVSVSATDGVVGSGPDFHDFGTVGQSGLGTDALISPGDDLSGFIGTGTFDVNVNGSAAFVLSGVTSSRLKVRNLGAQGTAWVTYEYVPEPGMCLLTLLGLGGLSLRRRRA